MTDLNQSFDVQDQYGSSDHFNGIVGTTPIQVPSSAGNTISEFLIECMESTPKGATLHFSLDGGTTYKTMTAGDMIIFTPKGPINQIYLQGSEADVVYEMIINREQS